MGSTMDSCHTDATGSCTITHNSGGEFADGTPVDFQISKTCSTSQTESVGYNVVGHF